MLSAREAMKAERAAVKDPAAVLAQLEALGDVRFDGMLSKMKDSTPIDDRDEMYLHVVRRVAQGSASEKGSAKPLEIDYSFYSEMPDRLRGLTHKISALYLYSTPLRIAAEGGSVEWVYRTYLADWAMTQGYVVDLLEPPPALKERTPVRIDGVFLKLGTYEGGRGPVQAPFFVGRRLKVEKDPVVVGAGSIGGWVMGVAVLSIVLVMMLTLRVYSTSRSARTPVPSASGGTLKT